MTPAGLPGALVVAGLAGAFALVPPTAPALQEFAAWAVRPSLLPFAWNSLLEAERAGDPVEAFARAQHVMRLLPTWADGHAAFAYRFVLAEEPSAGAAATERGERARTRLELAMAWLEQARPAAGRHEPTLLQALAFLPEAAVHHEPALAPLLQPHGGPARLADHYFAEAERLFPSPAAREMRTFYAPVLAAGLLAAGDRAGAVAVLRIAIERSHEARDQELAAAWRTRLSEALRWLDGDHGVDLAALRDDPRFAALLPHLR